MTDRTHPDSGRATGGIVQALQARIAELEAQLEAIRAGGVNGPLMGQPQAMPDLSSLTERGAVAWAGVDAQGLRGGGADMSKEREDVELSRACLRAWDASSFTINPMDAVHPMFSAAFELGYRTSLSANAVEPVAWQYRSLRDNGAWLDCTKERFEMRCTQPEIWETRALYAAPLTAQAEWWTKPHRTITYTCPVCAASLERQE